MLNENLSSNYDKNGGYFNAGKERSLGLGPIGTRNYPNNLSKSMATDTMGDLQMRFGDR